MFLSNNFNTGQANATTITLGNSGANGNNAFDSITSTPKYSTDQAHTGTLCMNCATGTIRQLQWTTSLAAVSTIYGRFYLYMTANFGGTIRIAQGDGNVTNNIHRLTLDSSGHLQVSVLAGSNVNTTATIALNQWVRIEWLMTLNGTTASMTAQLYNAPESSVATDTCTISGASTDITFSGARIGVGSNATVAPYFADLQMNDFGYAGSSITPLLPPVAVSQAIKAAVR